MIVLDQTDDHDAFGQEHVQHCVGPAWRGGEPVHRHPHRHGQQCLHVGHDELSRMRHDISVT